MTIIIYHLHWPVTLPTQLCRLWAVLSYATLERWILHRITYHPHLYVAIILDRVLGQLLIQSWHRRVHQGYGATNVMIKSCKSKGRLASLRQLTGSHRHFGVEYTSMGVSGGYFHCSIKLLRTTMRSYGNVPWLSNNPFRGRGIGSHLLQQV